MMGTVRARVRGIVRDAGRTVVQAVDDAGREYAVEVPEDIAARPACSTCGPSCGCGPCRLRHAGDHDHDHNHDHDHDRELVLVIAWSLHEMPPPAAAKGAAAEPAAPPADPASAASVDAAFMALLNYAPAPKECGVNTSDDLLALLMGPRG